MATTIQVSTTTKQMLDVFKEKEQTATYDQLLQHLVKTHADVPVSMFGTAKALKRWNKDADRITFQ